MSRRNPLTPEMERELEALDAALAGDDTDAELATIVTLVREERPAVEAEFARELDEWAAEGFPGKRSGGRATSPGRGRPRLRLPAWLRARPLVPALGVAATLLIGLVVATSLVSRDSGTTTDRSYAPSLAQPTTSDAPSAASEGGGAAGGDVEPLPKPDNTTAAPSPGSDESGVPGRRTRKQELSASLSLNAPKKKIDDVAAGVLKTTTRYGGVVMRSEVSSANGADFDLRIPAARLQPALAALSELGDVESRNQTSTDITAAFVSPRERLTDGLAERTSLLKQLAKADTPNETASIRARLRLVSRQIAVARGELRGLRERANYAKVSVSVNPRESAGGDGGAGGWGIGDGLDDGLRILAWSAGALIVILAVALPFLVLGGFAGAGTRLVRRRRREHALDSI